MTPSRTPSALSLFLQLAGAFLVSFALCASLTRIGGFPPTIWPGLVSWGGYLIAAVVIISKQEKGGRRASIGIHLVSSFSLLILMLAEFFTLSGFQPRPVFHNQWGLHKFCIVPYWRPDHLWPDKFCQYVRADDRDNLLVVILTGASPGVDQPLFGGMTEYTVRVGTKDAFKAIALPRIKDSLVVVLPDGTHRQFPLVPGRAKSFHHLIWGNEYKLNLLREAREVLDSASQIDFDAFIAVYREPLPTRLQEPEVAK